MCIAVYKPQGVQFPNKRTLRACFNNNSDGAGFMVADGNTVHINKGYMGFTSFWKALRSCREKYGDDKAYVMHFRITTQAGVRQDCTHPFPLSKNMKDLRQLHFDSKIGVAHNGIISLTTTYRQNVDYSDTMAFITDYLSKIIKRLDYYKDKDNLDLIDMLAESRLAILDHKGHCELIGTGWVEDGGVWYSNTTYKEPKVTYIKPSYSYGGYGSGYDEYDDWQDRWYDKYIRPVRAIDDDDDSIDFEPEDYMNSNGYYEFTDDCPMNIWGDESYCDYCTNYCVCYADEWGRVEEREA